MRHLDQLGVPLFVAEQGGCRDVAPDDDGELVEVVFRGANDPEFVRPKGWQNLTAEGNNERLNGMRAGMAICANTGGVMAVVDVDPRNGGDIDKVRKLLNELGVRIFAEVTTPSRGEHFYIAGHPDLQSVHSTADNQRLPGFPGVDIQSFGCNVFLPGTFRWKKYGGAGYTIEFEELDALAGGDPEGAEAFAQWVAEQRYKAGRQHAEADRHPHPDFTFERSQPWTGRKPDARQQKYLNVVLEENAKRVATSRLGQRNHTLYLAALKCASFVAGAGMDEKLVWEFLEDAATDCGLIVDDGVGAVHATIASALRVGLQNPRAVPPNRCTTPGRQQHRLVVRRSRRNG